MIPVEFDSVWAQEVEEGLEEYLYKMAEYVMEGEVDEDFETESGLPYCGCSTCEVREILAYIIPRVLQGHKEGLVDLVTD